MRCFRWSWYGPDPDSTTLVRIGPFRRPLETSCKLLSLARSLALSLSLSLSLYEFDVDCEQRRKASSVRLVRCSSISASVSGGGGGGGRRPLEFPVHGEGGGGVDLSAVGRALGLDPSTVRFNGRYLSRGPDMVSPVSWGSLVSFFAARGFPAGGSEHDAIVVQGRPFAAPGVHCSSDGEDGCGLDFKRKVRLEDERPLKKHRVAKHNSDTIDVGDVRVSDGNGLCIKRGVKMEDDNPSKKQKTSKCNPGSVNEASVPSTLVTKTSSTDNFTNGRSSVKLVLRPWSSLSISTGQKPISFQVAWEGHGGVDLGSIGSVLGLDPSTVRLNGHFLSHGPNLVSSVTWNSLLTFFSVRGFPTGDSDHNFIIVEGKPLLTSGSRCPDRVDGKHLSFKRNVGVEDESPLKKKRVTECNSSKIKAGDGLVRDDGILCIKRRQTLEDSNPFKKAKISE